VNQAQTGCVAEGEEDEKNTDKDDDEDEDDDDRRDRSASFSGCTSTGAPTSIAAFAALILLASFGRRQRRSQRSSASLMSAARTVVVLGFVATGTLSVGCAHAVRIESAPGAEILVNGKSVGTSPATYSETTGSSDTVQVTARLHGREKTVSVQRTDVDMAPIGAGAGIGAATCGTGLAVTLVSAFVFLPCAFVTGAASWGALAAAPAASWLFFSHKMPDTVTVDLGDVAPSQEKVAEALREDASAREKHRF
jgi:MYXO-CTERM domain-containing protein